jgi:hypothetical protein
MSFRHLSCPVCRIRVRASAPEIGLLEGSCPICGAALIPVSSSSGVLGFRSFDLDALSESESSDPLPAPGQTLDLVARREAALARDDVDTQRWSDEGGSVSCEAAAEWPATQCAPSRLPGSPLTLGSAGAPVIARTVLGPVIGLLLGSFAASVGV